MIALFLLPPVSSQGAFLVPAPPLSTRRPSDTESFVITPKLATAIVSGVLSNGAVATSSSSPTSTATSRPQQQQQSQPQLVKQHQQQQQQITTQTIHIPISTGGHSSSNGIIGVCGAAAGSPTAIAKSILLGEHKDATLIELLKRGTKVAVKRAVSDPGNPQQIVLTSTTSTSGPMTPTPGQRTLNAILQNAKAISAAENGKFLQSQKGWSFSTDQTTPLTLSIGGQSSSAGDANVNDVYTLTYANDRGHPAFFNESEVYGVNDTTMLLQAVDSAHLHHSSGSDRTDTELDDDTNGFGLAEPTHQLADDSLAYTPSTQLQAVLNSPLPDSLAEFSTLHSKEYILFGSPTCVSTHSRGGSPLPSPLAYPTPPASHEAVAQSSPFLDDSHHYTDTNNNPFFGDNGEEQQEPTKTRKRSLVDDDTDGRRVKSDDLFSDSKSMGHIFKDNDDVDGEDDENRLQDLSFLDEPQSFLDDDNRHVSSALSAAFFSSTMTSAEEVKEALQEVLPNETADSDGTSAPDAEIDMFYLPMLPLQSHMMSNSDDPLLSSSPKDFGGRPQPDRPSVKHDFSTFGAPAVKRHKNEPVTDGRSSRELATTEPLAGRSCHEAMLSPSGRSSSTLRQSASQISSQRKRFHRRETVPKTYELYKSRLKGGCLDDSPNCYTPAPILNPIRSGTGIYCCLLKDRPNALDEVESVPHLRLPQINVGETYQAQIPDYSPFDVLLLVDDEPLSTCLWSPEAITAEEQGTQVERFVELAKSAAMPMGSHSEEKALKALLDCQGEFQSAILELLQAPSVQMNQQWTPAEMSSFIGGLDKWQKDFYAIAKTVSVLCCFKLGRYGR